MKAKQIHTSSSAQVFKWGAVIIGAIPRGQRQFGLYLVLSSDEEVELGVGIGDSYLLATQHEGFLHFFKCKLFTSERR